MFFQQPLNITEDKTCNITPNSEYGKILQNIQVIIWDEITMKSKHAFEAVDRLFRDLCKNNIIFGGKVIIVSGDFGQTLPVVKNGNRTKLIENCLKNVMVLF